jgi:hypothetical protein
MSLKAQYEHVEALLGRVPAEGEDMGAVTLEILAELACRVMTLEGNGVHEE